MASSPPNSSASSASASDSKPTPAAGCCDHLLASPCKPIHPNHTLDLDDSDEEYEHGVRVMNREEMSRYYQVLRDTDVLFSIPFAFIRFNEFYYYFIL